MMLQINDLKRHNDSLRPNLERAISGVVESGWLALGPQVKAFESAFAEYCGSGEAIGVANGTDALTLALLAVGREGLYRRECAICVADCSVRRTPHRSFPASCDRVLDGSLLALA